MKRLEGKVAFITGGTKGIGAAIVETFFSEGALVAFMGRSEKLGNDLAKKFNSGNKEGVIYLKGDMMVRKDLEDCVRVALEKFGKIDVLVSNAGIFPLSPFLIANENEVDQVFGVNQKGAFLISQMVAQGMASRKEGSIIYISSIQGLVGLPVQAHYSATKGALIGLTRALAAELGAVGIRVNAVAPGAVLTETFVNSVPNELIGIVEKQTPLGRLPTTEDIASCALFLASDDAKSISGEVITVDGGWTSSKLF